MTEDRFYKGLIAGLFTGTTPHADLAKRSCMSPRMRDVLVKIEREQCPALLAPWRPSVEHAFCSDSRHLERDCSWRQSTDLFAAGLVAGVLLASLGNWFWQASIGRGFARSRGRSAGIAVPQIL